ncbi:MAG: rod shape-determining protein MreC, partial [Burkholderiales bacterium]|nr:rod shape-determining protein MreC [Burkholderiales bacterium]
MQRHVTLRLFRHGTAAEVTLTFLLLLAVALLFTDALWKSSNPIRQTIATAVYPFQRLVMFPNEALQRQRIEMAQVTTRAALLTAENEQLRRLLGVLEKAADRPAVVVEVLYEPSSTFVRRIVFNKGSRAGIAPGMPVIDESGVVGQITRVTAMTSEAAMLTDEAVSIPVQVLRNGLRLIAFGSGSPG